MVDGKEVTGPRVAASTPAEITRTFDALFSGKLLAAETLQRMLTLVPLPGLREPPMVIDGAIDTGIGCHSSFGFAGAVRRRRAKRGPRAS